MGVDDNFFEIGGDSIISIQVISRARQAGLHVEPKHVAAHPTVAQLATVAQQKQTKEINQEPVQGPCPLTPIQTWFFERQLACPHHWNQSTLFEVPADFDADALAQALNHCITHHDALRTRFEHHGDHWRQIIAAPDEIKTPLSVVDISNKSDDQQEAATLQRITEAQSSFDLTTGPLLRAVLFQRGANQPGRLLIAVHHLIVDVVSWAILVEDLESAYQQAFNKTSIRLPSKTTSYQRWAKHLVELSNTSAIKDKLTYWTGSSGADSHDLPVDCVDGGIATEATAKTVTVNIDAQLTDALLTQAHDAYQTRVENCSSRRWRLDFTAGAG